MDADVSTLLVGLDLYPDPTCTWTNSGPAELGIEMGRCCNYYLQLQRRGAAAVCLTAVRSSVGNLRATATVSRATDPSLSCRICGRSLKQILERLLWICDHPQQIRPLAFSPS
eukprot:TRINITY_DN44907_c1_g1_i1.p1 TRINITY_DN44907_c1_g1~~TRINITY_DN44907_c1_g1_i1.p1  ORF type:complete len:113 (+),score=18.46 TRINITY_DN44907_c1_g1_i1:305-643(+)